MLIGITGGIGGGKSTFSNILRDKNYLVFDTDASGRRLQNEDAEIRTKIIELLGAASYEGKVLNRHYVSEIVFREPSLLSQLNAIIHPAVKNEIIGWAKKHSDQKLLFIECAILFEGEFDKLVDSTLLITADLETRIERVTRRDRMTREQATIRINNQMSDDEKMKLADYSIITDDSSPLEVKAAEYLATILL